MTATEAAPAATTAGAVSSVIPPMAATGRPAAARAARRTAIEADRGVAGVLRAGGVDGADREIADRLGQRGFELRRVVGGEADDGVRSEQLADDARGQVVLANVHAVGAGHQGDVAAVVDDDPRAAPRRRGDDSARPVDEGPGGDARRAQLHEAGAGVEVGAGEVDRRPAGAGRRARVDDGVEPGPAAHAAGVPASRKRSR